MGGEGTKYQPTKPFSSPEFHIQEEVLAVQNNPQKLYIGIPKESLNQENRVALSPNSIVALVARGHRIVIENGAGLNSSFTDHDYSEAGAEIVNSKEEVFDAKIIVKVALPTLEECDFFKPGQILISPLQIPLLTDEHIQKLKQKRIIAVAMEYLQAEDGSYPVVRIMSELAGYSAILTAGELLSNQKGGRGVLLGGIAGVPPAKVVILGAGVVGEFATRAAISLGATVRIFDNNIYKLMRLQNHIGQSLHTSSLNPVYLGYQLKSADVVIGAIHSGTGRAPVIVTDEMVQTMKPGSVIIDISIDQGGCFETSEVTTHQNPTFLKHDVIHYCVPNIASKVSRTASVAISNILTPILMEAGHSLSIEHLLYTNFGIRHGVYMYKGCLTNEYLSKRFNIKYTSLDLLLPSTF